MKQINSLTFLVFLFVIQSSFGQSLIDQKTEEAFEKGQYARILPSLLKAYQSDSTNKVINYKLGICYYNSRSHKKMALKYFQNAIGKANEQDNNVPADIYKYAGESYMDEFKFDIALEYFLRYRSLLTEATQNDNDVKWQLLLKELETKIQMCEMGEELLNAIPCKAEIKRNENKYFETTTLIARKDSSIKNKTILAGKDTAVYACEATVATSIDGQVLLLYRNEEGIASIYTSSLRNNSWTVPQKLSISPNSKLWETEEWISADGNLMFFSGNLPGGYGGKDIYQCRKMKNGQWSKAINLGPMINTAFDEQAPFIHPAGNILFFSSNRNKLRPGYDIFSTERNEQNAWSEPEIVSYPLYTTIVRDNPVTEDTKTKKKKKQEIINPEQENYIVTFFDHKQIPLTVMKGIVIDEKGNTLRDVKITVSDIQSGKVVATYYSDLQYGRYSFILPYRRNNLITFEANDYLFHTENVDLTEGKSYYELHKPVQLFPIKPKSELIFKTVQFNTEPRMPAMMPLEIEKALQLLSARPDMTIEIDAHSNFSKKNKEENKIYSDKMAATLQEYFVKNGIKREKIKIKAYGNSKYSNAVNAFLARNILKRDSIDYLIQLKVLKIQE